MQEQAEHTQITVPNAEEEENAFCEEDSPLDEFFESVPSCESIFLHNNSNTSSSTSSAPCLSTSNGNHDIKIHEMASDSCNHTKKIERKSVDDNEMEEEGRIRGSGDLVSDVIWDDVFQTANCLSVFNNYLQLQMPLKLDILIGKVVLVTRAAVTCHERTLQSVHERTLQSMQIKKSDSDGTMVVKDEKIDVRCDCALSITGTSSSSAGEEMGTEIKEEITTEMNEEITTEMKEEISEVVKEEMGETLVISEELQVQNVNTADSNVELAVTHESLESDVTVGIQCKVNQLSQEANDIPMEIEGILPSDLEVSDSAEAAEVSFFFTAYDNDVLPSHFCVCLSACVCYLHSCRLPLSRNFLFILLLLLPLPLLFLLLLRLLHCFLPLLLLLFLPLLLLLLLLLAAVPPPHFFPPSPSPPPAFACFYSSISFSSSLSLSLSLSIFFCFCFCFCFCLQTFDLPSLSEALADMDRLHLCLINNLTGDLHSLLDLGTHC